MSTDDRDDPDVIRRRKADHIELSLREDSQYDYTRARTEFDDYRFDHDAFPEMALSDVDLRVGFLDKQLSAPILVASMTGGTDRASRINRAIASAVERLGLGMGLGSQRVAIEEPACAAAFDLRDVAPHAVILANLGVAQLNRGYGAEEARRAVEMAKANALFLHTNPLQEAISGEGDTDFRGLYDKIAALVGAVEFPVLVKECGAGLGPRQAVRLWGAGVRGIDVGGAGGTSWAKVEGMRQSTAQGRRLGESFRNWGIPTPVAIRTVRAALPQALIIGSGGIRSGVDAAKALALGADIVSIAQPILQAAVIGTEQVEAFLNHFIFELKIACFCVGARSVAELKTKAVLHAA